MAEYIDKHEAYTLLKDLEAAYIYPPVKEAYAKAARRIDQMKVADVQPVKHGWWIETHISLCKWIPEDEKEEGHSFYMAEMKCSCCERYNTKTFSLTLEKPDFCQHCGARMEQEGLKND